ncbi:MAG: decarboxylating 6-phosphogluconate dehydrogenase [Gemmatimonadaceae bacterium]|nr:decarboxylating 6-phosphogluconate dehydrogenase [Gemmatimonadaceae bacterium]
MQLGMIGLGRMGGNMTERLMRDGHEVVVFDRSPEAIARCVGMGSVGARDAADILSRLKGPRVVWIMVPAGQPVDDTIAALVPGMSKGDVIIDGGNSNFHDTMRRGAELKEKGIEFVDSGTSGGIWGLENGYCLMIGASEEAFTLCEPIFKSLAPPDGYARMGPTGSGHYVKMIHNGIEYGMLQAYAEGYEILHASRDFDLDLHRIAGVWNHGSVVRSRINELAECAFEKDADLDALKGFVADSGEGRWTVQEAIDLDVPAPVITLSLLMRLRSRQEDSFSAKVIAALRNEFGGHAVQKA